MLRWLERSLPRRVNRLPLLAEESYFHLRRIVFQLPKFSCQIIEPAARPAPDRYKNGAKHRPPMFGLFLGYLTCVPANLLSHVGSKRTKAD